MRGRARLSVVHNTQADGQAQRWAGTRAATSSDHELGSDAGPAPHQEEVPGVEVAHPGVVHGVAARGSVGGRGARLECARARTGAASARAGTPGHRRAAVSGPASSPEVLGLVLVGVGVGGGDALEVAVEVVDAVPWGAQGEGRDTGVQGSAAGSGWGGAARRLARRAGRVRVRAAARRRRAAPPCAPPRPRGRRHGSGPGCRAQEVQKMEKRPENTMEPPPR